MFQLRISIRKPVRVRHLLRWLSFRQDRPSFVRIKRFHRSNTSWLDSIGGNPRNVYYRLIAYHLLRLCFETFFRTKIGCCFNKYIYYAAAGYLYSCITSETARLADTGYPLSDDPYPLVILVFGYESKTIDIPHGKKESVVMADNALMTTISSLRYSVTQRRLINGWLIRAGFLPARSRRQPRWRKEGASNLCTIECLWSFSGAGF